MKKIITTLASIIFLLPALSMASTDHQIDIADLITGKYYQDPEEATNAFVYKGLAVVIAGGSCYLLAKRHGSAGQSDEWK